MKESGQLMTFPRSLVHLDLNNMHGLHQYAATMQAQSSSVSQLDSDRNIFDRNYVAHARRMQEPPDASSSSTIAIPPA